MTGLYEILGVPKDATPVQVKAAFRRASSAAHPDHGGSHAAQAAVNQAYEVLSDQKRRRHYDDTGETAVPNPVEVEARNLLLQIFTQALEQEQTGVLHFARVTAQNVANDLGRQRDAALARVKKLEAKRGKVRTTGEAVNLVHGIIDQQIEKARCVITDAGNKLAIVDIVREQLAHYQEDDGLAAVVIIRSGTGTSTSSSWMGV